MQTDIRTSSGIRTHDPSVWASEDGSCLRPRKATVIGLFLTSLSQKDQVTCLSNWIVGNVIS
jgi:hypothetical protein